MLFRISLCLTYFSFLAIQLSICGFPAAAGAFSGEKASCLARQLTYISTDEFFRQAFFEKNYDFFRNIFGKFFRGGKTPLPYTIYSMHARMHAYTADEKNKRPRRKKRDRRKKLFAAAARFAVARAFFDGFARGGEHFARPFAPRGSAADGADDAFIELFYEFFELFAAFRADIL